MTAPEETPPVAADSDVSTTESPLQKTARQLSRRTTDLLAIAIVSIGMLTISGRLLDWWSTDPNDVMSPMESATDVAGTQLNWGGGDSAVRLVAGDFPVELERRIARGSQDDVESQLLKRCRELLESGPFSSLPDGGDLEKTERRLLSHLVDLDPIASSPGRWSVYRTDQPGTYLPVTMLLGIRESNGVDGDTSRSLACWAMAIPHDKDQWTTFVFTPTSGEAASSAVPLPPDAEPVLSLRTPGGDELSVFRSREGAVINDVIWRRTIEDSLTRAGWQTVRAWQQSETFWSLRVEGNLSGSRPRPAAIELTLRETGDGRLSCIVNVIRKQ